VWDSNLRPIG